MGDFLLSATSPPGLRAQGDKDIDKEVLLNPIYGAMDRESRKGSPKIS